MAFDLNEYILWKPLKIASVIMYISVILIAPFSGFWSMILLFALVCLWSRIPCLVSMFTKDLDVIDFFVVMLAIHVGGFFGGMFGASIMLFSRLFGPNEWYLYTIKDAIAMMLGGFLVPIFHATLGSALYTLYAFTIFRWALYLFILTPLLDSESINLEIGLCTIGSVKSYFYNTFVMITAESYLVQIFQEGVRFNWGLLLFTTFIMGVFYFIAIGGKYVEKWFPQQQKEEQSAADFW